MTEEADGCGNGTIDFLESIVPLTRPLNQKQVGYVSAGVGGSDIIPS